MGSISNYLEDNFLDHILLVLSAGFSPAATLYVGLSTTDPQDSGALITEAAGGPGNNGYARKAITFGAASSRVVTQSGAINFDECTGAGWGTITHWFICDHATNTTFGTNVNMYAAGSLNSSKAVIVGNTPSIADTEITVTVNANGMSNYLANAFLDWAFRAQTLNQPSSLWVALVENSAGISDSDTGSSIDEFDQSDYARIQHDAWVAAAAGASSNSGVIDFGTLGGGPETVEAIALLDASTNGNLLFYQNITGQLIGAGDSVNIPSGDFDISIS